MKKSILILSALFFALSCSVEEDDILDNSVLESRVDLEEIASQKYQNGIMSFEDSEDFISFYNLVTNSEEEDYQKYLKLREDDQSNLFLKDFNSESEEQEITEEDRQDKIEEFVTNELSISEHLASIFNKNDQIKIGERLIEINSSGQFIDKKNIEENIIIGYVFNSLDIDKKSRTPFNINYTKNWVQTYNGGSRRVTISIFNETIFMGNNTTSKIFYRVFQQRESCSFWRCTWKDDGRNGTIQPYLSTSNTCSYINVYNMNAPQFFYAVRYTKNISNYNFVGPCAPAPQNVTGSFVYQSNGSTLNFNGISYSYQLY